jgi:ABC-type spermidine/putrescine transport system permease subunit I
VGERVERNQGGVAVQEVIAERPPPPRRRRRLSTDRLAHFALLLPTLVITAACFVIPLVLIAVYSFGSINLINFDVYFGWTTQNYRDFTSSLYLHTLARSVFLSVSTTLACAVLGFTFAYYISRQAPRVQQLLLVAVIVPFWTSFIVRTYAWVDLLQNLGPIDRFARALGMHGHLDILYTPYSIGIGILYSYLPLMILPIYVSLERIDPALYDASADLGATPWRQFRRVVLPHAVPGLIAGIIIVGVPALGEYVIPEILGGGKTLMAGNLLASQFLDTGNYPFGSALAVTVMVVLMVMLFLLRRAQPEAEVQ